MQNDLSKIDLCHTFSIEFYKQNFSTMDSANNIILRQSNSFFIISFLMCRCSVPFKRMTDKNKQKAMIYFAPLTAPVFLKTTINEKVKTFLD